MAQIRYLYPRLPNGVAHSIAIGVARKDPQNLAAESATEHPAVIFGTTGGARVSTPKVENIREQVAELARRYGFPRKPSQEQARTFDSSCAALLYEHMWISAHEAAQYGVWQFLCCVVLP